MVVNDLSQRAATRRDEIVDACRTLYETKTFREITISDIAKFVSFSRPSIYNYFETKEEIFLALFQREYELWTADLKRLEIKSGATTVEEFADAIADASSRRTALFKLLAMNLYDMEENSRFERLVEFKRAFKEAFETFDATLIRFFPNADASALENFRSVFWPFMSGVYPYANLSEKQLAAMNAVGLRALGKDERALVRDALATLLRVLFLDGANA